ncbi:MAG: hypothetical protein H7647_11080 [Candidatus Heimdallarchaeota archaeon]|nr:hypothetical protein [Candidatus Heimdallarchaeota archaeon]MCK4254969.1 hypothetical protein [Candidatus Heimdallarchaeota archaeon]
MSTKEKIVSNKDFIKQIIRGVSGALILILLVIIWSTWEGIYNWFYYSLFPNAIPGTLLMFWLFLLFPLIACGTSLTLAGAWKAYKIAVPPKEDKK